MASAFEKGADDLKLGHELTAGVQRRNPKPFPRPEVPHPPSVLVAAAGLLLLIFNPAPSPIITNEV